MTRHRSLSALTLAGLLALTGVVGSALPASAAEPEPTSPPGPAAEGVTGDDCPQWSWAELERSMGVLLQAHGRSGYELASFDADTAAGATTEFRCLTRWALTFANPRDEGANGFRINLDLRTGAVKTSEVSPRAPLPQTEVSPDQAYARAVAQGYTDPFYRLWLTTGEATGAGEYTVSADGMNTTDYIVVDAVTGVASNYYFPDLPDAVLPQQAGRYSGGTETLQAYSCPAHHPYLWDQDEGLAFKGAKLRGYRTGASMQPSELSTVEGLASGWKQTARGITTSDAGKDDNYLYALCTDDPTQGYAPPVAG